MAATNHPISTDVTAATYPISIPMEDELVHTAEHPFCSDPKCPCHQDDELIEGVLVQVEDGTLTPDQAFDVLTGTRR